MKKSKEELKQFFETGDKPTQQQYADLIDSYVDAKQPEGEANRRFVIDEAGDVRLATENKIPEYTLSDIVNNKLSLLKDGVTVKQIDLATYLDDTNLARLVSGTVDANGIATFTRDDNSKFTVDLSNLKENLALQEVTNNGKVTTNDIVVRQPGSGNIAFTADSPNKKVFILPQSLDILDQENKILTSFKESSLKIAASTNTKAFVLNYPSDEVINAGTGYKVLNMPYKSGTIAVAEEIPQYQAGTNVTIDKSNPLRPIINASGGGSGSSDNLGNHTATQNLDIAGHQILNVERITGKSSSGINRIDLGSYTRVLGQLDSYSFICSGVITGSAAQLTGTSGMLFAGNTNASGTNGAAFRIGATNDNKVVFGQRNTNLAGLIDFGKITATRQYEMPDKNGKVALLDDIPVKANFYEEGTSTVTLVDQSGGATYSFTTEIVEYTRVGNQVTATIGIEDIVTSGTPTGFLRLDSPIFTLFPVTSSTGWDPNISTLSGGNVNYYSVTGQMSTSGMFFQYQNTLDNTNGAVMSAVTFTDGRLRLTVTYKTNVYTL